MTDHIDAVNPENIPAAWDGLPVSRISVLADPEGHVFDLEAGNAPAVSVASAARIRLGVGRWSAAYVNESSELQLLEAIAEAGISLTAAWAWPAPGVYLWCADPSGNIAAGRWVPAVAPILVQDRYPGPYDLSTVFGAFPGRVAGYIDGIRSQWPAAAWGRFSPLPDVPDPVPAPRKVTDMPYIIQVNEGAGNGTAATTDGVSKKHILDLADLESYQQAGLVVVGVSQAEYDSYAPPA